MGLLSTTGTARPLRPSRVATSDAVLPWLIVAVAVVVAAATCALWAAGQAAEWATTGTWPSVGWSLTLLPAAAGAGPWPWPNTDPRTVQIGAAALLGVLLTAVGIASPTSAWGRTPRSDSMYRALGRQRPVTELGLPAQREAAARLRPATLATIEGAPRSRRGRRAGPRPRRHRHRIRADDLRRLGGRAAVR